MENASPQKGPVIHISLLKSDFYSMLAVKWYTLPKRHQWNLMFTYFYDLSVSKQYGSIASQVYVSVCSLLYGKWASTSTCPWLCIITLLMQTHRHNQHSHNEEKPSETYPHYRTYCVANPGCSFTTQGRVSSSDDMKSLPALLSLCEGNPLMSSGFPTQRDSYMESIYVCNVSLNTVHSKQSRSQSLEVHMTSFYWENV